MAHMNMRCSFSGRDARTKLLHNETVTGKVTLLHRVNTMMSAHQPIDKSSRLLNWAVSLNTARMLMANCV
jgi:hypothetical protein